MPNTFLEIDSLTFSYNSTTVFESLSFRSEHRRTVLKGPSGAGKTTLLKILSGDLSGATATKLPPTDNSCLVIQEDGLFPWLTGVENVLRITKHKNEQMIGHPMYPIVEPFIQKKGFEMSFGQRRLVELFRAIFYAPKYLYIDEPFNFLDIHRIEAVVPFFREDFLPNTILTISSHHKDEDLDLDSCIFRFEGDFPIRQLIKEK